MKNNKKSPNNLFFVVLLLVLLPFLVIAVYRQTQLRSKAATQTIPLSMKKAIVQKFSRPVDSQNQDPLLFAINPSRMQPITFDGGETSGYPLYIEQGQPPGSITYPITVTSTSRISSQYDGEFQMLIDPLVIIPSYSGDTSSTVNFDAQNQTLTWTTVFNGPYTYTYDALIGLSFICSTAKGSIITDVVASNGYKKTYTNRCTSVEDVNYDGKVNTSDVQQVVKAIRK